MNHEEWGEVARDSGILLGALVATCIAVVRLVIHPVHNTGIEKLTTALAEARRLHVDDIDRLREDLRGDISRLERIVDDNRRRIDELYGAARRSR